MQWLCSSVYVQCSVLGESGRNFQSLHVHTAHSKSISQCSLSVFSFLETPNLNVNLGYEFGVKSALPSSQLGENFGCLKFYFTIYQS